MNFRFSKNDTAAMLMSVCLAGGCAFAQSQPSSGPALSNNATQRVSSAFGKLPLGFEPNRGQTDAAVGFVARTPDATVFLAGPDAVLESVHYREGAHRTVSVDKTATVRMHLEGARDNGKVVPGDALAGTINYMTGNDRTKWQTSLPRYASVEYSGIYPGIDLRYHGQGSTLEYDFVLAPHADPAAIRMVFAGAKAGLTSKGTLDLPAGNGYGFHFDRPVAYQRINDVRIPVEADYLLASDGTVSFRLGAYDKSQELIIDPTLIFLGTLGTGMQQVDIHQMVVDSAGEMVFVGTTNDLTFPVTANAYQKVCGPADPNYGTYCGSNGHTSAFISKLSADGTQLVYSTYLSGTEEGEYGDVLAVDSAGVAYIAGRTASDTFPVTSDAYQNKCYAGVPHFPGGVQSTCDVYLPLGGYQALNTPAYFAKLSADGTKLLYASFLGGTQPVYPRGIGLDASGNIYISGQVYVFSNADLAPGQLPNSNLQYPAITSSGYLTAADTTDNNGNLHKDITTGNFLSKFTNDGHTVLYGTFFGDNTRGADTVPLAAAVGVNGLAFVGGYTDAANYPTTAGAIKSTCSMVSPNYGGSYCNVEDGYIFGIDTTKSGAASLVLSTRLGGGEAQTSNIPDQEVLGLRADGSNNLFVTGYTYDSTFPVPASGGYQSSCPNNIGNNPPTTPGYIDRCASAFLLKLNPTATAVLAGTYLGGPDLRSAQSIGYVIQLDSKGQVYLYGESDNGGRDFPQVNPLQTYHDGTNLFVATFTPDLSKLLFSTRFTNPSYSDHSVAVAGGMALDTAGNIYFTGTTTDPMFAGTTGTYNTVTTAGGGDHIFFAKLSKVLQPTTITASATPNPANQGGTVTYKAVVAGLYQNTPVPSGTVTFQFTNTTPATTIGTATLDTTGTATFAASTPAAGSYMLTASYGADTVYDVSTSTATTFTAASTAATTTSVASSAPTATTGTNVTFTAVITQTGTAGTNKPSGTVTFYDGAPTSGGMMLGTGAVASGMATYATSALAIGSHTIYAVYGGDTNFAASTGVTTQLINAKSATTTSLNSSATTTSAGLGVTFTATVASTAAGTPTGTVTFFDGTTTLGTGTLASGVATYTTSSLSVTTHTITASYGGDSNFLNSTSNSVSEVVNAATIAVSATPASLTITHGSTGTITITATPTGAYSGSLTFSCGALPASASCTFAPTTLAFSASTTAQSSTLTISTTAAHAALQIPKGFGLERTISVAMLPLALLAIGLRRRRLTFYVLFAAVGMATLGLSGCSSSPSSAAATTPIGSYTVPVVVSFSTGGTSTTNLNIAVQ